MHPLIDVTVAAIIRQDDRYLMVEEFAGGERVFNQPAGHVEADESLEQAVIRETMEETGYCFTPQSLLGIFTWTCETRSFLRIAFTGSAESPRATPTLDDGIIATHWLSKAELQQRTSALRSPMVMRCIEHHERGIQYPLETICELLPAIENIANIA